MYRLELEQLKKDISAKLQEYETRLMEVSRKEDFSFVTEFDIYISNRVQELFKDRYSYLNFFSEENPENFEYPVIVLDPLDGTREFVKGYGECAVSLAILNSADINDPKNYGWIYNPFSGFEISSDLHIPIHIRKVTPPTIHVMVSRSEWEKNLIHQKIDSNLSLTPMGSIAYKLGLLAAGACDVVISKRPKNVWDIAAGVIICNSRGIKSYTQNKLITHLNKVRLSNDFIWGRDREIEIAKDLIS